MIDITHTFPAGTIFRTMRLREATSAMQEANGCKWEVTVEAPGGHKPSEFTRALPLPGDAGKQSIPVLKTLSDRGNRWFEIGNVDGLQAASFFLNYAVSAGPMRRSVADAALEEFRSGMASGVQLQNGHVPHSNGMPFRPGGARQKPGAHNSFAVRRARAALVS